MYVRGKIYVATSANFVQIGFRWVYCSPRWKIGFSCKFRESVFHTRGIFFLFNLHFARYYIFSFRLVGETCSRFYPKLWLVKQHATPEAKSEKEREMERETHLASEPKICLPSTYIFTLLRITITFNAMQSEQCSRCLYICSARFPIARTWIMREIRTYKQLRQECGLRNWEGIRDFPNL